MPAPRMMLVIAALLGALGCGAGLVLDPRTVLVSYLSAAVAVTSIPLGALGVLMIAYLVRARWTSDLYGPLAAAAPGAVMARRAIDVEALAAALEQRRVDLGLVRNLRVAVEIAARDAAGRRVLQHLAVGEQFALLILMVFRLRIHVGFRASAKRQARKGYGCGADHSCTNSTLNAPSSSKSFFVSTASNLASLASTQRKNRSRDAR
jgi:hypothetical protein